MGSSVLSISFAGAGTGGFDVYNNGPSASFAVSGHLTLTLTDPVSNLWTATAYMGWTNATSTTLLGGYTALSGALQQVRVTSSDGTSTFDAGTINVFWE
jgi:hypothetical protein